MKLIAPLNKPAYGDTWESILSEIVDKINEVINELNKEEKKV